MEFRKTTVPSPEDPTKLVDGFDVPIEESIERWSEIHLVDGTVFRIKMTLASVVKLIDKTDENGHPVYFINGQPSVAVVSYGTQGEEKQ